MKNKIKIIIKGGGMNQMPPEQQEAIWLLSRKYTVYEEDSNGQLWHIIDFTRDNDEENVLLKVRETTIDKHDATKAA